MVVTMVPYKPYPPYRYLGIWTYECMDKWIYEYMDISYIGIWIYKYMWQWVLWDISGTFWGLGQTQGGSEGILIISFIISQSNVDHTVHLLSDTISPAAPWPGLARLTISRIPRSSTVSQTGSLTANSLFIMPKYWYGTPSTLIIQREMEGIRKQNAKIVSQVQSC